MHQGSQLLASDNGQQLQQGQDFCSPPLAATLATFAKQCWNHVCLATAAQKWPFNLLSGHLYFQSWKCTSPMLSLAMNQAMGAPVHRNTLGGERMFRIKAFAPHGIAPEQLLYQLLFRYSFF